jgi:sigma-E factor negative regulatory protein RseB
MAAIAAKALARTVASALFVFALGVQAQVSAGAAPALQSQSESKHQPNAQADSKLLSQIQRAAHSLNYAGVFTYQQGGAMESSRLAHGFDGQNETEKLELLDGPAREYLRHNEDVQCLIPEQKTVLLEKQRGDRFPGLLLSNTQAIDANYSVQRLSQPMRVAGRSCQLIDVVPRDAARYGYRLCADIETGLLLKAQTINTEGRVVEQVAFTEIAIGSSVASNLLQSSWSTAGWTVLEPVQKTVDLQSLGWNISAPAGFAPTSQLQQLFAENKVVHQMVLSDGLATISIFIEPYQNERSDYKPHGAAQVGSVNLYGVKIANFWLTVLGEVPASTLEKFAQSIQYAPSAASK